MNEAQVGIRELKTHLSKYMRHVKAGETLVITEYGKPIGRIVPKRDSLDERMQALVEAGLISWNGEKLKPREPVAVNKGPRMVSDLVVENRDVDYLS